MNPLLSTLAAGFSAGIALRRAAFRYGIFKPGRLTRPVVSVGNLTLGGTGKTPLVIYIAEMFLARGWSPCILTRGYRRRVGGAVVIPPEGPRDANPREVGDEPALLARTLPKVPIMVSANRYRAGRLAEERFNVDVHVLDDGFQHWSLDRDVDVVTIDATEDISDAALLPAGRFREPLSALARADLVVLTRAELADPTAHREIIGRINPRAEIHSASLSFSHLIDIQDGKINSLEVIRGRRAAAFCGIGNPRAFFASLRKWGIEVVREVAFRDHHVYGAGELRRLEKKARKAGAEVLLTTEKDGMNFPSRWQIDMPLFACATKMVVADAGALEEGLFQRLRSVRVAP